jgi:hypothetical protein
MTASSSARQMRRPTKATPRSAPGCATSAVVSAFHVFFYFERWLGEQGGVVVCMAEDADVDSPMLTCWPGEGHIAEMCPSPDGSRNSATGPECHQCHGRGHIRQRCPNNIPAGVCFKCGVYGHTGR